jgi:hypothetical protein
MVTEEIRIETTTDTTINRLNFEATVFCFMKITPGGRGCRRPGKGRSLDHSEYDKGSPAADSKFVRCRMAGRPAETGPKPSAAGGLESAENTPI